MGRFQLASHQSKQQKMLDRWALTTCCSCLNYSMEARVDSERAVLPWVLSPYMPSWSGVNMQAICSMQHAHESFVSVCKACHCVGCYYLLGMCWFWCWVIGIMQACAKARGWGAGGGEAEAVAAALAGAAREGGRPL